MRFHRVKIFCAALVLAVLAVGGPVRAADGVREVREQWVVETRPGDPWPSYWLVNKAHPELRQEMFLAGPMAADGPWISDVVAVDEGRGIYLIVYYAGQPGTSELVDVFYALIYDAQKKTLLGHFPYRRTSSRSDYSPEWVFERNRILIRDEGAETAVVDY